MLRNVLLKKYLFSLWIFLCLVNINTGKKRKKSYSYQFINRHYTNFDDIDYSNFYDQQDNSDETWLCLFLGICISTWYSPSVAQGRGITPVYEWSQLEFSYSEAGRQQAINTEEFVVGHPTPIDTDVFYSDNITKVFVTMPRFQNGIPVTLGTVTDNLRNSNPIIEPFPSWRWHQQPTACKRDRLVSVYRVKVDECGRLWVLDTGRLGEKRICPAQILAFDVLSGTLLHRYEIPDGQLQSNSILVTPVVDVRDPHLKCKDTFVYVADCQAMSLIVYDVKRDTSWHIIDKTMYPYPTHGTYRIAGEQFELMDGILGMALSPYKPGEDRVLFFHAMSSDTENWVYTSDIRNQSLFIHDPSAAPEIFHTYSGRRSSQAPGMAIDRDGIAYFGLASETSINCWNTATDYGQDNIVTLARNEKTMQFPSSVKVITNQRRAQELWFVTMRFQKIATGTLDNSETNFRIQAGKIEEMVKGTKCEVRKFGHIHHIHNNLNPGTGFTRPPGFGGGSYGGGRTPTSRKLEENVPLQFPNN